MKNCFVLKLNATIPSNENSEYLNTIRFKSYFNKEVEYSNYVTFGYNYIARCVGDGYIQVNTDDYATNHYEGENVHVNSYMRIIPTGPRGLEIFISPKYELTNANFGYSSTARGEFELDLKQLFGCQKIEMLSLNGFSGNAKGDLKYLSKCTSLTTIDISNAYRNSEVYGDVTELLNSLSANGKISGSLTIDIKSNISGLFNIPQDFEVSSPSNVKGVVEFSSSGWEITNS